MINWMVRKVTVQACVLFVFGLCLNPGVAAEADWKPVEGKLMTRWAKNVSPDNALPEYPRPQMVRDEWLNLNGLWDYAIVARDAAQPKQFDGQILVPYPVESALSGVGKTVGQDNRLWYKHTFTVPKDWSGKRIMLNFDAVDWEATLWVNGKEMGTHRGGYDAFSYDITDALIKSAEQEIVLSVWDPTSDGWQPRGKQVTRPFGIFYTAVTGIWQTVWLEPVNESHIKSLKIVPDIDAESVTITPICSNNSGIIVRYDVESKDPNQSWKQSMEINAVKPVTISIKHTKLWSPDSPFLYDLKVSLLNNSGDVVDEVKSYFGMRKIALGKDGDGVLRLFLNNEPLFHYGPLDQGWWPDGLYTAPTDEALRYDIEATKLLGFNAARKHVKIEPARWYYWCDKLGLLVWQDMPSGDRGIGGNDDDLERTKESAEQFYLELRRMVEGFGHFPCIVIWVPFNEGWGQFETGKVVDFIKEQDPTRLVINASGWADRGVGDILDIHSYPGPAMAELEENRAVVLGEFGGLGLPMEGHLWQEEGAWGYRAFQNQAELMEAYRDLIKNLKPMIERGLSAAIYTQTTDVETEVNGLMTYDRAVIKFDPDEFNRVFDGYFPPIVESGDDVFLESGIVSVKNAGQAGEVRYTTDGSEPIKNSDKYTQPITVTNTTTVKARLFWPDGTQSGVSEFTCRKIELKSPVEVDGLKPGLKYSYYEEPDARWGKIPDFNELTPKKSGIATRCDISMRDTEDDFALKFEGYVRVPSDGIYTFYTNSDDGSRLFIGSEELVENDFSHPMREIGGKIALKAGTYPIRITFYQGMGGKGLEVSYEGPGIEKQILTEEAAFHTE